MLRWWTGVALGHRYQGRFPLATFLINVSGAFLIGALSTLFSIESVSYTHLTLPTNREV